MAQRPERKLPRDDTIRDSNFDLRSTVTRMKMRWIMIVVVVRDNDPEETRNLWHRRILAERQRVHASVENKAPASAGCLGVPKHAASVRSVRSRGGGDDGRTRRAGE